MPYLHTLMGSRARAFAGLLGLSATLATGCGEREAAFPRKPIRVIVPFAQGGASTEAARPIERAVNGDPAISPEPLVLINVPGHGGAIGSRRVKNAKPDGYTILNLHDAIITAKYVEGGPEYGPEAFVPIAATCEAGSVLCVGPASKFENLQQLLGQASAKPGSVRFGSNYGAPSHFVALLLERELDGEGAKFSFPPMEGGGDRSDHLLAGRIEVTMFSVSEYRQFSQRGVRAIAFLGEQRHPKLPGTPTAKEQGVDLVAGITQMWWAPPGTPADRVDRIAGILEAAMKTEFVKSAYEKMSLDPVFIRGEALQQLLGAKEAEIAGLDVKSEPISAPPTTAIVLGALGILGVLALLSRAVGQRVFARPGEGEAGLNPSRAGTRWPTAFEPHLRLGLVAAGLIVFIGILGLAVVPFWIPALAFSGALGALLAPDRTTKITAVGLAVVVSVGLHLIFRYVLIIDLP